MIVSKRADSASVPDLIDLRSKFCKQILQEQPSKLFLTLLWEPYSCNSAVVEMDNFMFEHKIPTTWIVNKWAEPDNEWKQLKSPVIFFDFFVWRSFNEVFVKNKSSINPCWNYDATKFLFLLGKAAQQHRIGLLWKLHNQKLLDQCNYSFFSDPKKNNQIRKILRHLTEQQIEEFIIQHQRKVDTVNFVIDQHGETHYGGIPYDADMYKNSLFRLVSETSVTMKRPWITEKTWLTIANKNPFVIAAEPKSCEYLETMGFCLYDKIFRIPSYDNVTNHNSRLVLVVEHVKHWLQKNFDVDQVNNMVEHNYLHFVNLANKIKLDLELLTQCDIDAIIDTTDDITGF